MLLDRFPAAALSDPHAINKEGGLSPMVLHALAAEDCDVTVAAFYRRDEFNETRSAREIACTCLREHVPVCPRIERVACVREWCREYYGEPHLYAARAGRA